MIKRFLSLSVLIAILWGCCSVEDTPQTEKKETPATYKVVFDANGGSGVMPEQIFTYGTPQPLNANVFKRTGYVFTEWNTSSDGTGAIYMSGSYYSLTSDITLYAQWEAEDTKKEDEPTKTYTVKFNANGGSGEMADMSFTYDVEQALTANTFTREGYTFAGWAVKADGNATYADMAKVKNLTAEDKATVTLYAVWNAEEDKPTIIKTYTVKFDSNGGNGTITDQVFTYDVEQALTANTFTREGYTFAGWAVKADGNATYADMAKVKNLTAEDKATVILYAVWNENDKVLPVIFSLASETAVDYGDSVTLSCATDGAKISYTIVDETVEYTDAITITKDVIITAFATKDGMKDSDESTASYTVKTYTVTYTTEYGVAPSKIDGLKKGDTLTAEELPKLTTDGYTFAGWYNGENEVTTEYKISSDLNLTAKWNADTDTAYTVEHYQQNIADDEYILTETDTETGTTDEDTSATAKDYAGFTAKTIEQMKIAADGSTVVKIYYDRKEITLTLDLDGGEGENSITGKYGADVTTPANPTKTGYTFAGWNSTLPTIFTEDTAYTATWTANTDTAYKVEHYQQNIADDEYILTETDTETGTTDEDTSATAKDYAGFTAKTIEQMKIAADGSTVVKIYYDRKEITLTLDLDGGEGENSITGKYGADVTTPANPTKTGYTFARWDSELPTTFPAENATYTALWEIATYTITYILKDGVTIDGSNPVEYTIKSGIGTLAPATKVGYNFLNWYITTDNGVTLSNTSYDYYQDITGNISLYPVFYKTIDGFVYVQGATINGAIPGDDYKDSEIFKDGENITVGDFYMSDHEVTQAEYETYCIYGGTKPSDKSYGVGNNYPAYYVSWYDALVYCNIRSTKEGLTPCYTIKGSTNPKDWGDVPTSNDSTWNAVTCNFEANGYRLPTEAEWEYAARGGNGLVGYQYKYAGNNTIGDVAWYTDNSSSKTHEVKGNKVNGLGLYDMSGNVWEWCWDADSLSNRCRRGGSWLSSAVFCTVSYRYYTGAINRTYYTGFRVVRTAK